MKFRPHPYQQRALRWALDHPFCGLFLDMGLGKSVVTLTAFAELVDLCEAERALVIAPKTVAETTWSAEAAKWDHLAGLRVSRVLGTAQQRQKALAADADVYVINRENVAWLFEQYRGQRLPWDVLILDELGSFKNPSSIRFKALRRVRSQFRRIIGLTGTPTPNGLKDLWAQIYCLDGGERLGRFVTHYRARWFDTVVVNHIPIKFSLKPGAEQGIRRLIGDICITMRAADYLDLPPMNVIDVPVTLPPAALKAYAGLARDRVLSLKQDEPDKVLTADNAAALIGKLSQIANGALYDDADGENGRRWTNIHRAKVDRLCELIEAAAEPVLVFYQYRFDVDRIREALPKELHVEEYEGADSLERWNAGQIDVLLAHPASTAYGLNMQQGGRYIVWFGTGWNLDLYQQANARLYRQGQVKPVTVYRLLAVDTVDIRAAAALDAKDEVQRAFIDSLKELVDRYG